MSFDDLAFPNGGASSSGAQVRKRCPACEEERQVAQSEWVCPACGERLLPAQPTFGMPDAQGNAMLRQLMSGMAAAASSSESIDAGAGGEEGAASVAAQLQSLFIPSLNSTYASMAAAQQGLSIEELMTRLLQDSSLHTSSPVSKAFLEALKPRPLVARDFLQAYLRFEHLPGMQRDVFPTIAGFGAAGRYIQEHAQAQAEEKTADAAAEAAAAAAAAAASAPPAAEANATAAAATAAAPTATAPAAAASASSAPAPSAPVRPPAAPRSHSSGVLLVSSPLSLAPPLRNGRLFRGRWLLAERGVSSFVAKARAAQDLMAKGLIIMQTEPDEKAWPFTMSDTNKTGGDIIIPCVMISQSDGAALQAALATKAASSSTSEAEAASVTLLTRERPLACCVCREDYEPGSEVVELPCSHFFCMDCILPWLKSRSNCPLCRFALPTEAPKQQADPPGPESNQSQLRRDMYT